jgi:lipopolysaccharide heptosyltransferase II
MLRQAILWLLRIALRPLVRRKAATLPQNMLYIKPDHLGDVLLATPALRALRAALPQAQIVALVGPWGQAALARETALDRVLLCPFPGFVRGARTRPWQPYLVLLRYAVLLRRARYDAALIGRDDHWWGGLLALAAGIPVRVGVATPLCGPLLTHAVPYHPRNHVAAQGLALVAAVVGPHHTTATASYAYRYAPGDAAVCWADDWLAQHALDAVRLVVLHPGTGGASKLWPAEYWAAVAHELQQAGYQVVLTGGPGEEALVAAVASALHNSAPSLVGQTSVDQLAALMARAQLVLGVDSGPLHLAAAVGAPSLHLFGPSDHARFAPWADAQRHRVLRADLWCSPCGVLSHCPRGRAPAPCMAAISAEAVLAAAQAVLTRE